MRMKPNSQVMSFSRVLGSELVRAFVCFHIVEHQKNEREERCPACGNRGALTVVNGSRNNGLRI